MVNFKDIFDISMYKVEVCGMREEGDLLIEEYDITLENKKISQSESIYIEFEEDTEDVSILNMLTWSEFDKNNPEKTCSFCGCKDMELEDEDDEDETLIYTHKCNFDEEEVKDYLRNVVHSEYLLNNVDEENFKKHYTIVRRDIEGNVYEFIDEWSNSSFYIQDNVVYHQSLFLEEMYCFHCSQKEDIVFDDESLMYYQRCPILTHHVDKFVTLIKNRTDFKASSSHEDRYGNYIGSLKEEEKEENKETPQERLQRVLNEIPTDNEREHQLINSLKHKLKDKIEIPVQEHVFRIKEEDNKVSLSLEGIVLSMLDGGYEINFYDELFVMKLNEDGQTVQYLNEIMLKDIESWGFWFGENDEDLTEAIKEAEDIFNSFLLKRP